MSSIWVMSSKATTGMIFLATLPEVIFGEAGFFEDFFFFLSFVSAPIVVLSNDCWAVAR